MEGMNRWQETLISPQASLQDGLRALEKCSIKILLVTDPSSRLLGTVTDGDFRRGILKGLSLQEPLEKIMNPAPLTSGPAADRSAVLRKMKKKNIRHLPVVDDRQKVIGMEILDEQIQPVVRDNWVVLMAGGLGSRMGQLTAERPKSMLPVGEKPILEIIVNRLREYGFRRFFFSVHYKAEIIEDYFKNGSEFGVEISYLHEDRKLGTAGALSLLPEAPQKPLLVMNSDLLTKVNFHQLMDFHSEHKAQATMCVRQYDLQVPYGVVKLDGHSIQGIDEKPVQRFFVNAGIYVLEPAALAGVPKNTYFDMPRLFEDQIRRGSVTAAFPVHEYWLDVGRLSDFERANNEFAGQFEK